jgi:phage terminase small subunit
VSDVRKSPPGGLGTRGSAFWDDVTGGYELERDEFELLTEVCRQMDVCEALSVTLAAEGVTAVGSRGQVRVHPLVMALNAARRLLGQQLAQLGLPDSGGGALPSPASVQASRAARSRWRGHTPRGRRGAA